MTTMRDLFESLKNGDRVKVHALGETELRKLRVTVMDVTDEFVALRYDSTTAFVVALDKVVMVKAKPRQISLPDGTEAQS